MSAQAPLVLICIQCKQKNRVDPRRLNDRPVCGACKTRLTA